MLIGGAAFGLYVAARSLLTAGVDPATSARATLWVPVNALGFLGAALVLLGLPAILTRPALSGSWRAPVGVALVALAWMLFGLFLSLYGALIQPWLADRAPQLIAASASTPQAIVVAFVAGSLAWLIGAVLLAIPFLRGVAQPRWVGYVLPASAVWAVIGDLMAPNGPASSILVNLVSNLGPVLLVVALGDLGFQMWSNRSGVEPAESTT